MTTQVEGYCYICVCHICYTRDTIVISNLCEKQCFISLCQAMLFSLSWVR